MILLDTLILANSTTLATWGATASFQPLSFYLLGIHTHLVILPASPFFINFRCLFGVCFLELPDHSFLQKVLESASNR